LLFSTSDPLNIGQVARLPLTQEAIELVLELYSARYDSDTGTLSLETNPRSSIIDGTRTTEQSLKTIEIRAGSLFLDNLSIPRPVQPNGTGD